MFHFLTLVIYWLFANWSSLTKVCYFKPNLNFYKLGFPFLGSTLSPPSFGGWKPVIDDSLEIGLKPVLLFLRQVIIYNN